MGLYFDLVGLFGDIHTHFQGIQSPYVSLPIRDICTSASVTKHLQSSALSQQNFGWNMYFCQKRLSVQIKPNSFLFDKCKEFSSYVT